MLANIRVGTKARPRFNPCQLTVGYGLNDNSILMVSQHIFIWFIS